MKSKGGSKFPAVYTVSGPLFKKKNTAVVGLRRSFKSTESREHSGICIPAPWALEGAALRSPKRETPQ